MQDAFARVPRHVFVPEVGRRGRLPGRGLRDQVRAGRAAGELVVPASDDGDHAGPARSRAGPPGARDRHRQLATTPPSWPRWSARGARSSASTSTPTWSQRREASLAAAGYDQVTVLCADGGYGDPADAPFDRIIVTAGAWDIAPAWLDQLAPGGLPGAAAVGPRHPAVRGAAAQPARSPGPAGDEWLPCRPGGAASCGCSAPSPGPEPVIPADEPRAAHRADVRRQPGRRAGPPAAALAGAADGRSLTSRSAAWPSSPTWICG